MRPEFEFPSSIALMADPDRIPTAFLPFLAWRFSVDDWDPEADEANKRAIIKASIDVHRIKGTIAAVKRVLEAEGYGDAIIEERQTQPTRARPFNRAEGRIRGNLGHWADYRIILERVMTLKQARRLAPLVIAVAPVRSRLVEIRARVAGITRGDGTTRADGKSRGLTISYTEVEYG